MRSSRSCKIQNMNRVKGFWFNFSLVTEDLVITHPSLPWQKSQEDMYYVLEFSVKKDQAC